VLELRDESWRRILDVNLTGMFIATQEAGRVMAARVALARLGEVLRQDLRLDLGALAGHLLPEAHGGADELLVALALGDEGALALDLVDAAVDDQLAERLADDRARNAEALAQLGL
jgi:hypothetical protein